MTAIFSDSSPNAFTVTNNDGGGGGVTYDTVYPVVGTGDASFVTYSWLSVPMVSALDISAGNWTIEFRVRGLIHNFENFIHLGDVNVAPGEIGVGFTGDTAGPNNVITCFLIQSNNFVFEVTSSGALNDSIWNSVAAVLNGTTLSLYINGVQDGTGTLVAPMKSPMVSGGLGIGGVFGEPLNTLGYIDEFRISNIARYTSNYTPATVPFVSDAHTVMLLHMDPPPAPVGTIQAGFAGPRVGTAVLLANPGNINPRIYPPEVDVTAQALPQRILS